ncbi:uncharacterized protein B4U80_11673 [Leptotrombidium deliense]|uniref:BTB domain-containing protein n=1 Tax=Leptotrombidium deliense TaxID=299467 RepID=A0A443S3U7_9ACAR|nr:uncharacterized protein B4U80_11673 [Leptotrombidium deliense]
MSTEEKFNPLSLITAKYLFNEDLSDVTFVVLNDETGEKETIFGHKFILADNCPYFKNLFYGESKSEKAILINKSVKIMKPLLEYVYTKKIAEEIGFETSLSLCELAMEMKYDSLFIYIFGKGLSERIIDTEITIENISIIYFISKKFSLESVVQRCNRFVESNAKDIIGDKLFTKLEIFVARKVVREAVKVMDNVEVFKAIANRIESVGADNSAILLKLLNLTKIDQKNFAKFIRPTKLINDYEYFAAFWTEDTDRDLPSTTNKRETDSKRKSVVSVQHSTHKRVKHELTDVRVSIEPLVPATEQTAKNQSSVVSNVKETRRKSDAFMFPDKGETVVFEFKEAITGNCLKFALSEERIYSFDVHVGSDAKKLKAIAQYAVGIGKQKFIFNEMDVKFVKITSLSNAIKIQLIPESLKILSSEKTTKYQLLRPTKNMLCSSLISREMIFDVPKGRTPRTAENFVYQVLRYPCYVNSIALYFKRKPSQSLDVFIKEDLSASFESVYRQTPSQFKPLIVRFELKRVFVIKIRSNDLNKIITKVECPATETADSDYE